MVLFLLVLLPALFFPSILSCSLYAQTLTAPSLSVSCGDTDQILDITLDDAGGMLAYQFDIVFDPQLITPQSINTTPFSSSFPPFWNVSGDRITVASSSGSPHPGGGGVLCQIHISVSDTAPDGSTSPLDLQNALINDNPVAEIDGILSILCGCTGPPPDFALISPSDGALNLSTSFTLDWEDAGSPPDNATSYDLYLGRGSPPPLHTSGITQSTIDVTGLDSNATYYWYVTGINNCGQTPTPTWTFSTLQCTAPPSTFTNLSPEDGASGIVPPSVILDWETAQGAASYDLYLSSHFPPDLYRSQINVSQTTVADLVAGTAYYWFVRARNECGITDSPVWGFATQAEYTEYIPVVARDIGAHNTNWRSDLALFNPGDTSTPYTLTFRDASGDHPLSGTIEPGHSERFSDVVGAFTSSFKTAGNLQILSDRALIATSRTYNDLGDDGTFGQFVASVQPGDSLYGEGMRSGSTGYLLGLDDVDPFRTNIGFSEMCGEFTQVRVFSSSGTTSVDLQPYEWIQMPLEDLGLVFSSIARIEVLSGGCASTYASVVDNRTGDAIFIPVQPLPTGDSLETAIIIPVAARTSGNQDTLWRTDLWIYNSYQYDTDLAATYRSAEETLSTSIHLPAGSEFFIQDVLEDWFEITEGNTSGSLILEGPFVPITVRIYNDRGTQKGTYGQRVLAKTLEELSSSGSRIHLSHLTHNAEYRCNVGFTEVTGTETSLLIVLYDHDGNELGRKTYTVHPFSNLQISPIFEDMEIEGYFDSVRATVEVLSGGVIYAYASVVDNRNGDAIFIPAVP